MAQRRVSEPASSAPGRRHPPAVRRRLIIEAARMVIAQRGMAATRMREVASAAGVSLGTLTYHFTGIDELLAAVIEADETESLRPLVAEALAAETGRGGLRVLVEGLFNDGPPPREHWLLWLDFWTLASHNAKYGQWQDRSYREWRSVIDELVERGETDGSLTVTDRALRTTQFMALVDGMAAQAFLTGRESTVVSVPSDVLMWTLVADLFQFSADAPGSADAGDTYEPELQEA